MRLRAITPIVLPDDELERRRVRYSAISPPNISIQLDNLPSGPSRLETENEIRMSETLVFEEAMRTDVGRFDGIFLDCVLDPALEQLQSVSSVPVFGISYLVSNFLGSLGFEMAAVARNEAIAHELADRIDVFGWSDQMHGVIVLDLSLQDIGDTALWNRTVGERLSQGDLDQVDVVINGCSAVEVRPAGGPQVIDPTALALRLVGLGADLFSSEEG
jgi:Asp/Glu/hydantoin racemase